MNLPSQPAPQARTFQSWRSIFLATILLATVAITISTFYFATVHAESHGAITGLTLTSNAPGTLTVSWDAASPTPTDYRVDWAKSDEEYTSWKVDDGHAYPASTATAVTIADLEHDTEYKIRMRARYYRGEHEGKSWGGPWATETITVAGEPAETPTHEPVEEEPAEEEPAEEEPAEDKQGKKESGQRPPRDDPAPEDTTPAAPSLINTAVTEGQVLLSWLNPSDDSITGYQILRGPDADSLVVIEDDTGSTSTNYTDTAPPAGQTHTYGVKARNASGLSPAGTATAAVPEVLITARHEDGDNTLVSNLNPTDNVVTRAVVGTHVGFVHERAMSFTTGNNPYGYHLTNSQLYLRISSSSSNPTPGVSIRNDNEGVPGQTVLYTMTTTSAITAPFRLVTFTTTDDFTLQPNTKYWLYVTINDGEAVGIQQTQSDDENVESNTDWEIGDSSYRAVDGVDDGAWTEQDGENIQMNISGHAAPAFLVSNLDSPSTLVLFSRRTDADVSKFAQAFSAANNENGTPAEFDFHGVIVQLESDFSTASQLADSDILVTVHKDSGGQPGDLVYTLTSPATYTVPVPSGPVTFWAPPGSILSSGINYWLKFEIAADSTFFTGLKRIDFEFATDNNEVQGPTTNNRWSIGDDSLWSPETLSWMDDSQSIQMSVLGAPHYDTLVSNIDQTFLGTEPTGAGVKAAQSFRTPTGRLGQQYRLHRVRINAISENPTHAMIDLHADDNGAPGNHLASMIMPGDFTQDNLVVAELTATTPRNTNLNPGTRYWFIFSNEQEDNLLRISVTESKAQDSTSLDGWTIGDRRTRKFQNQPWAEVAFPIQMELLGTPSLRTDEADGPDLPGAGHNAHKTGAIVTPGIVSTGHLTPGLDYDHGHTGDFWWLDTERGHSYRIEVEFGDSQNNDTGGSAWTYFIEGDRRGTCCESDHNRDDGHTFVHFRRPTDDWIQTGVTWSTSQPSTSSTTIPTYLQRSLHNHDDRHHRHRKGRHQPIPGHQD